MVPYKPRTETTELRILKSLYNRMELNGKDKQHYFNLKKGYEGEVMFDKLTEKLECECYILNDLLLKVNSTTFQIDTLIISETIYCYDVKNFDGDHFYESGRFYQKTKIERSDPLIQLTRAVSLLRQLLTNLGFNIPIDASVVFINPEFTLYQAPLNQPIILPTQLKRYMEKLNRKPSKLAVKHKQLADKLIALHIDKSPYMQLPHYEYKDLKKGIACEKCNSFDISIEGHKSVCKACGHKETVTASVMRNIKEFELLFPDQKITTNVIHEWCKVVDSKKRIRRILQKNSNSIK